MENQVAKWYRKEKPRSVCQTRMSAPGRAKRQRSADIIRQT